jgi:hypothetical protein
MFHFVFRDTKNGHGIHLKIEMEDLIGMAGDTWSATTVHDNIYKDEALGLLAPCPRALNKTLMAKFPAFP